MPHVIIYSCLFQSTEGCKTNSNIAFKICVIQAIHLDLGFRHIGLNVEYRKHDVKSYRPHYRITKKFVEIMLHMQQNQLYYILLFLFYCLPFVFVTIKLFIDASGIAIFATNAWQICK